MGDILPHPERQTWIVITASLIRQKEPVLNFINIMVDTIITKYYFLAFHFEFPMILS